MNIKYAKAHKLSRRMYFRDLEISIETDKGELRHWFDPHTNTRGSTKMKFPYGYIRRTKGTDGDHVDVYVGPNERAKNVYIVNQMKAPDFEKFDEQKCMLGFLSENAARTAYLTHYDNPKFFGSMTVMPYGEFKEKVLHTFDLKRPTKIANYLTPEAKRSLMDDIETPSTLGALAFLGTVGLSEAGRARENKAWGGTSVVKELRQPLTRTIELLQGTAPVVQGKSTWLNSYFLPHTREIRLPERASPGMLAHEIAHGKTKMIPGSLLGRALGLLAPFYTLPALYKTDPDSAKATALTYAPTALMAPRLLEEGRASIRAYQTLKQLGKGRQALLSLLPMMGTYLASTALPIGLGHAIRHHRREREEHPITKDWYPRLRKALALD